MKNILRFALVASVFCVWASAADLYVSISNGKNKNAGTKDAPFKNIQKAIDKAQAGDVIHIAKGNYFGLMKKGYIEMKKPVSLIGGYSTDFASRDVVEFKTMIQPPNKSNGTSSSRGLLNLEIQDKNAKILIDGIIFDKGESNSYHASAGKPEGLETGMLLHPPSKNPKDQPGVKMAMIRGKATGDLTIQNCFFTNGSWYAISLSFAKGNVRVLNNAFVANTMSSAEIWGTQPKDHLANLEFANNTVLFTWSRTKALEDMGYGVRIMTKMDYNIHNNLIGLSSFAGIDNTRSDPNKKVKVDNNVFFLNKQADMSLPSGGGQFMRVYVDDFEDIELDSIESNTELKDAAALKDAIFKPYLEGFINATYTEQSDFDPSSPANTIREAMGLNKVGKLNTKVSMYANKYPLDEVFKLVGILPNAGMQSIK